MPASAKLSVRQPLAGELAKNRRIQSAMEILPWSAVHGCCEPPKYEMAGNMPSKGNLTGTPEGAGAREVRSSLVNSDNHPD